MRALASVMGLWLVPACNPPDFTGATETASGASTSPTTSPAACGDGVVDPGEQCDDGNQVDGDGCEDDCTRTPDGRCGDGLLSGDEECDDANVIDTDVCTAACKLAVCGDGSVLEGTEECDDGNNDDTDACLSTCKLATCGDGIVQSGVEECDDGNNIDTDACTNACKFAVCGDGVVQDGVEQCDNGDDNSDAAYGGCTSQCELGPRCGDGIVQDDVEQCDDGTPDGDDLCNACVNTPRRYVFVTAATYSGNTYGLNNADVFCGVAAINAELGTPGSPWRAWLSNATDGPVMRMDTQYPGWYVLPGDPDIPVAKGWTGLTSGKLLHPINRTETGETLPSGELAWTNTRPDGTTLDSGAHCVNWTSDAAGDNGRVGDPHAISSQWTAKSAPSIEACNTPLHLYCVEN